MAQDLNKTRMRDTRILVGIIVAGAFLTSPALDGSLASGLFRLAGYILLTACALGRIYSTAFIGGVKNEKLMTVGPYSMCRNPLYFYSLLGAAGIGLMSGSIVLFAIIFGGFLFIYDGLIKREEEFLAAKFGNDFAAFKAGIPRLVPNLKKYSCPEELVFQPRFLTKAVWDAIWWFAPVPLFELAHLLHQAEVIRPLFRLL